MLPAGHTVRPVRGTAGWRKALKGATGKVVLYFLYSRSIEESLNLVGTVFLVSEGKNRRGVQHIEISHAVAPKPALQGEF